MGQSPDGKTYNTDGQGMPFYQGKTEFGELYIRPPVSWTTAPTRIAEKNDVLMSVRAPVGSTNIATEKCCLGRGLAAIRPIEGKSTTMFILYSMRSIEEEIENMGVGSTFKAINKEQVHALKIPIVSLERQDEFVALAEQSDKSKLLVQRLVNMDIFLLIGKLSDLWKEHFKLGTQYVGYLSMDTALTLMSAYRYSENLYMNDSVHTQNKEFINQEIRKINRGFSPELYIKELVLDSDCEAVLPVLCRELAKWDLSELAITEKEWNSIVKYMKTKAQERGRNK